MMGVNENSHVVVPAFYYTGYLSNHVAYDRLLVALIAQLSQQCVLHSLQAQLS